MKKILLLTSILLFCTASKLPLSHPIAERIAIKVMLRLDPKSILRYQMEVIFDLYPLDIPINALESDAFPANVQKTWRQAKVDYLKEMGEDLPLD